MSLESVLDGTLFEEIRKTEWGRGSKGAKTDVVLYNNFKFPEYDRGDSMDRFFGGGQWRKDLDIDKIGKNEYVSIVMGKDGEDQCVVLLCRQKRRKARDTCNIFDICFKDRDMYKDNFKIVLKNVTQYIKSKYKDSGVKHIDYFLAGCAPKNFQEIVSGALEAEGYSQIKHKIEHGKKVLSGCYHYNI